MQSGLNCIAKLVYLMFCTQGTLSSKLVSIRVVWSKLFDFFTRTAWPSAVTLNFETPQVNANWRKPIPNSSISTLLPTGQLAVLIWLHLDQFSSSCWSFGAEKLGLRGRRLHANALWTPF
jgi:hypothetical protein